MPFRVLGTLCCVCVFVRKVRVIYSCLWKQRIRILVFWLEWALIKRFLYSFRIRKSVLWGLYSFPKHNDNFPGKTATLRKYQAHTYLYWTVSNPGMLWMWNYAGYWKIFLWAFQPCHVCPDQITPPLQTVSSY